MVSNSSRENSTEDILMGAERDETKHSQFESQVPLKEVSPKVEGSVPNEAPAEVGNKVKRSVKVRWQKVAEKCATSHAKGSGEKLEEVGHEAHRSMFLNEGEGHVLWKPRGRGQQVRLAAVVGQVLEMPRTLSERRKNLEKRVQATRAVLKADSKQNLNNVPSRRRMTFKDAANKVKSELHVNEHYSFHDVVSQYVARMHAEHQNTNSLSLQLKPHLQTKATPPPHVDGAPPPESVEDLSLADLCPVDDHCPVDDLSRINPVVMEDTSQNPHIALEDEPFGSATQDSLVKRMPPNSPAKNAQQVRGTARPAAQSNLIDPLTVGSASNMAVSPGHSRRKISQERMHRQEGHLEESILHESWC